MWSFITFRHINNGRVVCVCVWCSVCGLLDYITVNICCIVLEQRAAYTEWFKADLVCLGIFCGSRQNLFVCTLCGETCLGVNVQRMKCGWLCAEPTAALTHPFWIKRKAGRCSISASVTAMAFSVLVTLVCLPPLLRAYGPPAQP